MLAGALLAFSVVGWFGAVTDDAPSAQSAGGTAVTIVDFSFEPAQLAVTVGDTVAWTNEDSADHTVTSDGSGPLGSGDLDQGGTYEHTFRQPGTYEYICTIHPTMAGTVEVSGS